MIVPNNPSIDVEALMRRVRTEATRLREGGELEHARRERWRTPANRLKELNGRQKTIESFVAIAELRNQPRAQVPARFAKLQAFGKYPFLFTLRVLNYFYKPQRETAGAQNAAMREMLVVVNTLTNEIMRLSQRVNQLTERLEERERSSDDT